MNTNALPYGFQEKDIELLPEEENAIERIREAYLTILRTANDRKLNELKTKFEEI